MRRFGINAAVFAAWALAAPAMAADYTILIYEPANELALRTNTSEAGKAYWAEYGAYAAELTKAGAIRGGAALVTTSEPGSPLLSGFFMVSTSSRADAEALAAAAPANRRGGRAELREQLPAMAAAR